MPPIISETYPDTLVLFCLPRLHPAITGRRPCLDDPLSALPHRGNLYTSAARTSPLSHRHAAGPHPHNSSFEASARDPEEAVETLGFKFTTSRSWLISHAHSDHCARQRGKSSSSPAQNTTSGCDVPVVESGGKSTSTTAYRAATGSACACRSRPAQRRHGRLGGSTSRRISPPAHPRHTTWTMDEKNREDPARSHRRQPT